MVEHMVLFKFKEETTKEQKDEGMKRLRKLKQLLPGIIDIQTGHNFSKRAKEYVMGLTIRFESKAALENYSPSPEHQAVVSYLKSVGMIETLSLDFEIE